MNGERARTWKFMINRQKELLRQVNPKGYEKLNFIYNLDPFAMAMAMMRKEMPEGEYQLEYVSIPASLDYCIEKYEKGFDVILNDGRVIGYKKSR